MYNNNTIFQNLKFLFDQLKHPPSQKKMSPTHYSAQIEQLKNQIKTEKHSQTGLRCTWCRHACIYIYVVEVLNAEAALQDHIGAGATGELLLAWSCW